MGTLGARLPTGHAVCGVKDTCSARLGPALDGSPIRRPSKSAAEPFRSSRVQRRHVIRAALAPSRASGIARRGRASRRPAIV